MFSARSRVTEERVQLIRANPSDSWHRLPTFFLVTTKGERVQGCHWHLVTGSQDAAEYPTVHRTAPVNKELLGPKANSAEVKTSGEKRKQ